MLHKTDSGILLALWDSLEASEARVREMFGIAHSRRMLIRMLGELEDFLNAPEGQAQIRVVLRDLALPTTLRSVPLLGISYVDGVGLYQYTVSNPTTRKDPFGLQTDEEQLERLRQQLWLQIRQLEDALKVCDGNDADQIREEIRLKKQALNELLPDVN